MSLQGRDEMIIGITGKSGSGKTTMANLLAKKFNFEVIHVDEIAHEVLTLDRYNEVLSWIGISPKDNIDRKFLGTLLFQNQELMSRYNAYIYELIKSRIDCLMSEDKNYIIDWNFLPITPLMQKCNIKILMKCPDDLREKHISLRDGIDNKYFSLREKNGLTYENESDYDFIFVNDNLNTLDEKIDKTLGKILWK